MDLQDRIELVKCFYSSGSSPRAALRQFKLKKGLVKDPFSLSTITRLISKFEETGSITDKPRSGRPSVDDSTVEEVEEAIAQTSESSSVGSTSVRRIANETGLGATTVHRIMRNHLRLFPYKLQILQSLEPDDKPKRLAFANWLLSRAEMIPNILWSDEANFSLDGSVNTNNCRIWLKSKPEFCLTRSLHSPKVCVWLGFTSGFILRPFFFEGTVNSDSYLEMLQNHVRPQLSENEKLSDGVKMVHHPTFLPECENISARYSLKSGLSVEAAHINGLRGRRT